MSFDTDFDYTTMVNKLTDKIRVFEETSEQLAAQIAQLEINDDPANDLTNDNVDDNIDATTAGTKSGKNRNAVAPTNPAQQIYINKKVQYDNMIADYNTAIDEIEAVEALSYDDKLILWRFYAYSRASLYRYMRVIAHSHKNMLADDTLRTIISEPVDQSTRERGAAIFAGYTDSHCV